jgi:hypothetical protein
MICSEDLLAAAAWTLAEARPSPSMSRARRMDWADLVENLDEVFATHLRFSRGALRRMTTETCDAIQQSDQARRPLSGRP